jgi:hypothetical protein
MYFFPGHHLLTIFTTELVKKQSTNGKRSQFSTAALSHNASGFAFIFCERNFVKN